MAGRHRESGSGPVVAGGAPVPSVEVRVVPVLRWLPFVVGCVRPSPSSEVLTVEADPALVQALTQAALDEGPLVEAFIDVRTEQGEAVSGAILARRSSAAEPWVELGRSRSGSAVHFVPGGTEVTVLSMLSKPGSVEAMKLPPEGTPGIIRRQKMTFEVKEPCTLAFSLSDRQGAAVAGARLELWRPLDPGAFGSSLVAGSWEALPVVTDEAGAQAFPLDCGETLLKVSPPEGPAAVFGGIVPGAGSETLDLVLPETWVEVGGVVRDTRGEPVAGLALDLGVKLSAFGLLRQEDLPPHEIFTFRTTTDEGGRYLFRAQAPDQEKRAWALGVVRGATSDEVQEVALRPGEPAVRDLVEPRGRWVTVGCQTAEGLQSCESFTTATCRLADGATWPRAQRRSGTFEQRWCPVEEAIFQFDTDAVRIPVGASATVLDLRAHEASVAFTLPSDQELCMSTLRRPLTQSLFRADRAVARIAAGRGGGVQFSNVAPGDWVVSVFCGLSDGELSSLVKPDWSMDLEVTDQAIDLGPIRLE
jgi:protocatechuate 3,4-dioxygenase beta subunit